MVYIGSMHLSFFTQYLPLFNALNSAPTGFHSYFEFICGCRHWTYIVYFSEMPQNEPIVIRCTMYVKYRLLSDISVVGSERSFKYIYEGNICKYGCAISDNLK